MKDKNVFQNLPGFWVEKVHYGLPNQVTNYGSFGSSLYSRDIITCGSISTPGWSEFRRWNLPNKHHTLRRVRLTTGINSHEQKYSYNSLANPDYTRTVYTGAGEAGIDVSESPFLGEDPSNLAISRLQKEVAQSSGSILVTLAEGHKTAKMIAETATKLAQCYRSLRKGNLGFAAESLGLTYTKSRQLTYRRNVRVIRRESSLDAEQFVAQQWLAMSYGWKPLLSDVYAQAENFARIMVDRSFVLRQVSASAKSEEWRDKKETIAGGNWYNRRTDRILNVVRYTVRYTVQDGPAKVANTFGLLNPALVAWELVPFSFVADWFLPIGNFLENLTAYNGLSFGDGTKKHLRVNQVSDRFDSYGNPVLLGGGLWRTTLNVSAAGSAEYVTKVRTPIYSWPYMGAPQFKDPRSFAHAASAIALIQSVFRGSGAKR